MAIVMTPLIAMESEKAEEKRSGYSSASTKGIGVITKHLKNPCTPIRTNFQV